MELGNLKLGQTPISSEEAVGLIDQSILSLGALDLAEKNNIRFAQIKLLTDTPVVSKIIDEAFLRQVHRLMFNQVWRWAGTFRRTDKNFGCPWPEIALRYRQLRDDTNFWIANKTFPPDEIAIRYKHLLVSIHPFPNGNGRHSRLMADLVAEGLGCSRFSWGADQDGPAQSIRMAYLSALRAADQGNLRDLIAFSRS